MPTPEDDNNRDGRGLAAQTTLGGNAPTMPVSARGAGPREDRIGPYKILQTLGEGGMGEVYLAEQEAPVHRRVALKVVKLGMDTREVLSRFEAERQTLALLDHPNIARMYDAGATETGRPYFAMEHVPGLPITEYCDLHRMTTAQRLGLFREVCEAVQHAHQNAIIHRDLKPSNILITETSGRATPKVIDFGVAKALSRSLTERPVYTEIGQIIGTPEYMSPEQAENSHLSIDTRADIYSLGVILYELLTGNLPLDSRRLRKAGYTEVQRIIREEEPPLLTTRLRTMHEDGARRVAERRRTDEEKLRRELRGDLEWIVSKAMDKDRTRRFASASELWADIARFLGDEPVLARPPSAGYRTAKFIRRHKAGVATAALVCAALLAGLGGTAWQAVRATRAEALAERRQLEAERSRDEAVAQRDRANIAREVAEQIESYMTGGIAPAADPESDGGGRDVRVEQVLDTLAAGLADLEGAQPEVAAALRTALGRSYLGISAFDKARPLLEASLSWRLEKLGPTDARTLESRYELGELLRQMGQMQEAETQLRDAWTGMRATLGSEHTRTLRAAAQLSATLRALGGRIEEADGLAQATLEAQRRVLGPMDRATLETTHLYGMIARSAGRPQEAAGLFEEAYAGRKATLGAEHITTLKSLSQFAAVLRDLGRRDEAEAKARQALEARERTLGPDHNDTLISRSQLASVLEEKGDYAGAEALYQAALEGYGRRGEGSSRNAIIVMSNLVNAMAQQGPARFEAAETLARRATATAREQLGGENPVTVGLLGRIAGLRMERGDYETAEELYRQAVAGHVRAFGEKNARTLSTRLQHARCLVAMGRFDGAAPELEVALAGFTESLGADHAQTRQAAVELADVYERLGRGEEAASLRSGAARPLTPP